MSTAELLSLIAGLAGLLTGVGAFIKTRSETRKADAEAEHSAIDAAGDAIALVRQVYEERIKTLENEVSKLRAERETDRQTIIDLNRRLGEVMRSAQAQSDMIRLWRERVEELLCILRDHDIQLPGWAH